ncbi:hypothetical protein M0R45_006684 [Rubus argutus]|uniref:Uncharacterized protein n=1 Tax=Rubus argutus TaxID=59490 RepID=A0AAW1YR90_RUBAR
MGMPKLGFLVDVVEQCTVLIALDAVSGLNGLVSETKALVRPSPIVMEQCQEALSYDVEVVHLTVLEMIVINILSILKSVPFSRDCFVAAGVSFCVALQVCLSPEELGWFIIKGIFRGTDYSSLDANGQSITRGCR